MGHSYHDTRLSSFFFQQFHTVKLNWKLITLSTKSSPNKFVKEKTALVWFGYMQAKDIIVDGSRRSFELKRSSSRIQG